ncbi:SDR family NAD(P)-dependent oxidoreductase [Blastomonas marina]|jgi:NAD(P)-dependent dehydrogenase (short-subunit alcohol dehydrogenase family)|uniref:SDR family NAD(P)-dependent oxidoreductase n=1 Tax=Blastomonas marina TaxID=1867408 RepID=UPI002AC93A9F|nr:SDR family NAD(P)-dependent oxidoreductase [Blastomonas marina]WPZ03178.1 SDR family NAD(P)-dependent oxidoreductase [Blastomonas marina]
MSDKTIAIIGASRGLGLGLAKEFASRGWKVLATERSEGEDLHQLADEHERIELATLDVTDPASFDNVCGKLADGSLDAVIVNAGITGAKHQSSVEATPDEVAHVMMTNAYGPIHLGKKLLPKLRDGGTIAFMSSLMGSIADSSGGYELYRTSKAAQNMLAKGVAEQDAGPRDIEVLSLHPGWVQTDMGGPNAKLTVEESVTGMADVVEAAGNGGYRFVDYSGKELPF